MLALAWLLALPAAPADLLADLQTLDRALTEAASELAATDLEVQKIAQEIAVLRTDSAAAAVQKQAAFDRYKQRIRALERQPAGARVALLGGAQSLTDYLEMTRVLRWVASHDQRLMQQFERERERLAALEAELLSREQQLAIATTKLKAQRESLAQRRQERLQLLAPVLTDPTLAKRLLGVKASAEQELLAGLRRLTPKAQEQSHFVKNRGNLPWPTVGSVLLAFGAQPDALSRTIVSHPGLTLKAAQGAKVQAIAAGTVVYADWLKGYGQIVILDHGDGYHSLVAHLGTLAVAQGAVVASGELLGTVGDTGSLHGTQLYFELREQGVPVDPRTWLRRS